MKAVVTLSEMLVINMGAQRRMAEIGLKFSQQSYCRKRVRDYAEKECVLIHTVAQMFHPAKLRHVRIAMALIAENRPSPRVHKDNFMRGGGVHLEYCALGLS